MQIQIIDNFLPLNYFCPIQDTLINDHNFPWYYWESITQAGNPDPTDYQFVHIFYEQYRPNSQYVELLQPIIDKLNPSAILRIKANLITHTEKQIKHAMHVDFSKFSGKTAILYVNDCDGYTEFQDGSIVESKANRLVVFPAQTLHTGTSPTDAKVRCLINLNYYEWSD